MSGQAINVEAVLGGLKDFQRRTAVWAFNRMFDEADPAVRFLVADEVGLGKTHVAKGVIAQVIDYLGRTGDERHDIVYVCSNAAIARQNIRKLTPPGIEAHEQKVDRLTMLPLAELNEGGAGRAGINILAITPGTSLKFGRSTGRFHERCLAYTFLRAHWGTAAMTNPARRIFWQGVNPRNGDSWLKYWERVYRPRATDSLEEFAKHMDAADRHRAVEGRPPMRAVFDQLVADMAWKRTLPFEIKERRKTLIAEVRSIMAQVGIARLSPDLVVLDEFQRFKDLLDPDTENLAAQLARRLFNHRDPETGRATRTLLLSATPYRMYTTSDEDEDDHYADFLNTCSFLFADSARVERLKRRFRDLRSALGSTDSLEAAESVCNAIEADLRSVMARTERLAATPDRNGMLDEAVESATVMPDDLRAYMRFGELADMVKHHEPTEYWKSAPYLMNFMETYRLKQDVERALEEGRLDQGAGLDPGPGLLSWEDVEAYERLDPQNARLRWLLEDLHARRAFELLWVPPSLRYYDAESVYESPEAAGFTKRLLFSGWRVVPKVVSSLVSFEAERRAFADRSHDYSAEYGRRGGGRLTFRTSERPSTGIRPGEAGGRRRAAAMTTLALMWPSPSLAALGDPRPRPRQAVAEHPQPDTGLAAPAATTGNSAPSVPAHSRPDTEGAGGTSGDQQPLEAAGRAERRRAVDLLAEIEARVAQALDPLVRSAPTTGVVDRRWYWAAPLFLDRLRHPGATDFLLASDGASYWEHEPGRGLKAHVAEARAMVDYGPGALGPPPDDLAEVLAELALGGPAQCALRAISSVTGLPVTHQHALWNAAWIAAAFRDFFNAPEVTAAVVGTDQHESGGSRPEDSDGRYWRDVVRHSINGNLQAVLDEHLHVLRDWLGHLELDDDDRRVEAADDIGDCLGEALDLRTSTFRVDIPGLAADGDGVEFAAHRMRSRFAVAFGHQTLDEGGEARIESVSKAFNSPFWPFVLTSTSIGQEGLDFHLWCHAVVHWNLPANPVDLEQREGRVHRYKGHAVRRNIAATLGPALSRAGLPDGSDLWTRLFDLAAAQRADEDDEMVPYWVFHQGPAKIQRHVPMLPFSREAAALPQLRKTLAAYRLAFGQPRQEELVEFLGENLNTEQLNRLSIDLSPPE